MGVPRKMNDMIAADYNIRRPAGGEERGQHGNPPNCYAVYSGKVVMVADKGKKGAQGELVDVMVLFSPVTSLPRCLPPVLLVLVRIPRVFLFLFILEAFYIFGIVHHLFILFPPFTSNCSSGCHGGMWSLFHIHVVCIEFQKSSSLYGIPCGAGGAIFLAV